MKVCILGSGVMGSGITSLFALSDQVEAIVWWGRHKESLKTHAVKVKKEIGRFSRKNKISKDEAETFFNKIVMTDDLSQTENCDLYIEAIVEDLEAKQALIASLSGYIPPGAIVASNTSSLSITALSMHVKEPANFIGMHFFNPTSVMMLVEVVKGLLSSDEVIQKVVELVEDLGRTPVIVNESPGFIVNRMLIPMINEAVAILAEGVASKEAIDQAMKCGANHPIGPIALADLIGTDVCLSIMETLHNETGDPKYRAHSLLRQYVRAEKLGRKVGVGFYEYK